MSNTTKPLSQYCISTYSKFSGYTLGPTQAFGSDCRGFPMSDLTAKTRLTRGISSAVERSLGIPGFKV
jgi:hypothetical protein